MSLKATLPMLAGSRSRAQQVMCGIDTDLQDREVSLNGQILVAAAIGFTDELVVELLVRREADALQLVSCSDEFVELVLARAAVHGVEDHVKVVAN